MSQAIHDLNRRLLRARDAMDRTYAQQLDVPALATIAHVSEAHFIRSFRTTLQVHTDADLGFMRWLTVSVPGDPSREIRLAARTWTTRPPTRSAKVSRRPVDQAGEVAHCWRTIRW
jgi:hypothetical protein